MKKLLAACAAVTVILSLALPLTAHASRAAPAATAAGCAPTAIELKEPLIGAGIAAFGAALAALPEAESKAIIIGLLAYDPEADVIIGAFYVFNEPAAETLVTLLADKAKEVVIHATLTDILNGFYAYQQLTRPPCPDVPVPVQGPQPPPPPPICDNWYSTFYCADGPPPLPAIYLLHNSLSSSERVTYNGDTDPATGLPIYYGPPGTGADGCASYGWGKPRTISSLIFGKEFEVKEVVCLGYNPPPTQKQLNSCPKGQHYSFGDCIPGSAPVPAPVVTTKKPVPAPPEPAPPKPAPVVTPTMPDAGTDYLGNLFGGGKLNNCNFATGYLVGNCNPHGETEAQYIADPGGPVPAVTKPATPAATSTGNGSSGCLPGAAPGTCIP